MKILLLFALLCAVTVSAAEKKVLTIGNSFTWCLAKDLPAIVKAQGDKIMLRFANHGGCSIQRHWKYVTEEEAKPEVRHYKSYKGKKSMKLREILADQKWDIITIQQVSTQSWVKGSFYPELDKLVAYVKKHAPGAKILLHQTWSYRADHRLYKNKKRNLDPARMYKGIYDNYKEASKKFKLQVIPAGLAIKIAEETQKVKFTPLSKEKLAAVKQGQTPPQPGSFHAGWAWRKNRKTGKIALTLDGSHLNRRGTYLQSCVWYGFIYGKSPLNIKYDGYKLTKEDAAFLRQCADKALKTYR